MEKEDKWISVVSCPACGSARVASKSRLASESYHFGNETIMLPHGGVYIIQCPVCRLAYKSVVPSKQFLARVFLEQSGNLWQDSYDYFSEKSLVNRVINKDVFDMLDIGPSNGGMLKALSCSDGRRSGLDIVSHPGLKKHLRGEFICSLLDENVLSWSKEPYDVITAFDVFEHFYSPYDAFENLGDLLKDNGVLIGETGDVSSYWPSNYGLSNWWYVNCFEHHVFWSKASLEWMASHHGFQIELICNKEHKFRKCDPLEDKIKYAIQVFAYCILPMKYRYFNKILRDYKVQPYSPFAKDHIRYVLRKC